MWPRSEYRKVSRYVNMEWLVPDQVIMFRSHVKPYMGRPAPIDGACVLHIYSKCASEIKGLVAESMGGAKMLTGYRAIVGFMNSMGYSGVKLEIFNEDGTSTIWVDGKRVYQQQKRRSEDEVEIDSGSSE